MRYEYFKIIDPAFVQSLLDGNLYMNSLSYFRTLEEGAQKEGNKAQKDPMEGVCGTIPKNRLRQVGFHFSEDLLEVMGNHVPLLSENYGYNNLFCLYRLQIDEDAKTIQQPSRQLVNFNDKDNAQKVVIRFRDSEEFLRRLETALQTALTGQALEYAIYGGVTYENAWTSADGPGTRSAFHKDSSYAYQEEWRLCILRREWVDEAVSFPVGDLKELCEVISLEQFINHLAQHYGFETSLLDITNDARVALFFATCQYDWDTDSYRPLTQKDIDREPTADANPRFGMIFHSPDWVTDYLAPMGSIGFGMRNPDVFTRAVPYPLSSSALDGTSFQIGYQPFYRCQYQRGYIYPMRENQPMQQNDHFEKLRFRQSVTLSKRIYDMRRLVALILPNIRYVSGEWLFMCSTSVYPG
jgi:hypothetical protein